MILASASPRRRMLLEALGVEVCVMPTDIDESRLPGEHPLALVERLAKEKARAAYAHLDVGKSDELLLAADTIVWDSDGDVFGKPHDDADARRMLHRLSGMTHHVSTGVCLLYVHEGVVGEESFVETTDVSFHRLSGQEIDAYVASGEPLDKAGGYGIQGRGQLLVSGIAGDYLNVVGLPVGRVVRVAGRLAGGSGRSSGPLLDLLRGGAAHAFSGHTVL